MVKLREKFYESLSQMGKLLVSTALHLEAVHEGILGMQSMALDMEEALKKEPELVQTLPNKEEQKWYNTEEAAKYLKRKKSTVWKLYESGQLEGSKPGGKLLMFTQSQLDDFLSRNLKQTSFALEEEAMKFVSRRKRGGRQAA